MLQEAPWVAGVAGVGRSLGRAPAGLTPLSPSSPPPPVLPGRVSLSDQLTLHVDMAGNVVGVSVVTYPGAAGATRWRLMDLELFNTSVQLQPRSRRPGDRGCGEGDRARPLGAGASLPTPPLPPPFWAAWGSGWGGPSSHRLLPPTFPGLRQRLSSAPGDGAGPEGQRTPREQKSFFAKYVSGVLRAPGALPTRPSPSILSPAPSCSAPCSMQGQLGLCASVLISLAPGLSAGAPRPGSPRPCPLVVTGHLVSENSPP